MATKYAIETIYRIIDRVSGPLAGVNKSATKVSASLKRNFNQVSGTFTRVGRSFDRMAKRSIVAGGVAIAGAMGVATKQFVEFESSMTKAGALFKDMDVRASSFKATIKSLGSVAREVAAKTEFTAVDTAEALQKMAMAGVDSSTAMKLLAGTADLATAAGVGLGDAVGIAMDSMGALGMTVGADNLQRISDIMAKAGSLANTDLVGVFDAIKNAGPIFTSAGQSVETLAAAIDMLAAGGIKAEEAGTQLKAIFMQLSQTAKRDQLKQLGISVTDTQGNFLSLVDIMDQLDKKLSKMGGAQRSGIITGIFGARGAVAINNILNGGVENLKMYERELQNASGAANTMAETMRGSLANRIEVLKSALTELGLKFAEGFATKGGDRIKEISDKILELSQNCGPLVDRFNKFIDAGIKGIEMLWKMRGFISDLVIIWAVFKATVMVTNFVNFFMPFLHLLGALILSTQGWTVATASLNAAWAANPVGLVVAGLAVMVGLVILAVKHWDKFEKVLLSIWNVIKGFGAAIFDFILAPVQGLLSLLSKLPGFGGIDAAVSSIDDFRKNLRGEAVTEPVTAGERMAYIREESVSKVDISVAPEKGSTAHILGSAPDVNIQMVQSGSF